MRRFLSAFLLISVMLLTSCETLPPIFDCPAVKQKQEKQAEQAKKAPAENTVAAPKQEPQVSKEPTKSVSTSPSASSNSNTSISQKQKQLVDAANWAKGRNYLTINGHRFKMDCSGVVRAIYFKAGIDLAKDFNKYKGGGTQRIHEILRSKGLIYRPTVPVPGDILFWDNTYDANHNGRSDDTLSHIGMVVSSDKRSGNVVYVHHHEKKGIVFEKMNLLHPNDPDYNAIMRSQRARKLPGNKYLASHLYKDAGKGYLLR